MKVESIAEYSTWPFYTSFTVYQFLFELQNFVTKRMVIFSNSFVKLSIYITICFITQSLFLDPNKALLRDCTVYTVLPAKSDSDDMFCLQFESY